MTSIIDIVSQNLLLGADLSEQQLESVLGKTLEFKVDFADLYLQSSQSEEWVLEDGIVKEGDFGIERGFGLRVISGEKTGFAYADDINLPALQQAANSARSIVTAKGHGRLLVPTAALTKSLYPAVNPIDTLTAEQKVALLQEIDHKARARDSRIKQVIVRLVSRYDTVLIMNSAGMLTADIRPMVRLYLEVVAFDKHAQERGVAGGGGRSGYEFLSTDIVTQYIERAVDQAIQSLSAKPAPVGTMPVVLGPGWPAVLLHEAVGHGLESDFCRKGSSVFSNRLGEQVASPLCTIVDDATIDGRRGSLSIDDEGTPGQRTVLIENGRLVNYMSDIHNAKLMGTQSTGNGRRESYAYAPIPRMTNTYMLAGKHDPQEIIASVQKGIYAADFSGGQVDITSGKFVFTASEAYLIENGRLTAPVKGAAIVGNGPDVLQQVSMVGNDLALDSGVGSCGKEGQYVPVGVGQPTLKLDKITVGGSR